MTRQIKIHKVSSYGLKAVCGHKTDGERVFFALNNKDITCKTCREIVFKEERNKKR